MRVYYDFYLVPGSRSTFPEVDPDPAQWYGSDRIRYETLVSFTIKKYGFYKNYEAYSRPSRIQILIRYS